MKDGPPAVKAMPDAPVQPPGDAVEQVEPSKCGGQHEKEEASARARTAGLPPLFAAASLQAQLVKLIADLRDAASRRAFGEVSGIVSEAWKEMARLRPGTSEDEEALLAMVARSRMGAFATCRSIADDDPGWCAALDESWGGERTACQVMHTVHRRIALKAVRGGASCEKAMKGSPEVEGLDEAGWVATCRAIRDMKPEDCPAGVVQVAAMCRAAADREGSEHCKAMADDARPLRQSCCVRFAWRLANVLGGAAQPRYIPEQAALDGDAAGCDRAVTWGLFDDLAGLFGVPDAPTPEWQAHVSDEYLCRYQVFHSFEEVP